MAEAAGKVAEETAGNWFLVDRDDRILVEDKKSSRPQKWENSSD